MNIRIIVLSFLLVLPAALRADLVYDPITNLCYSLPVLPSFNAAEYIGLVFNCVQLKINILNQNNGVTPSKKILLEQISRYLKGVGTPTALRLLSDIEKDKIFYPDGSVMCTISS